MQKNFMKKIMLFMLAILMFTTTACDNKKQTDSNEKDKEKVENKKSKEIKIAAGRTFWQGPKTSIYLHGTTNVWESLTILNKDMDVEMVLADSMNMSKDGKSWNIKLKSGVKFHDGTILNAEVVKLNLDRLYHFNPAKKEYDSNYKNIGEFGEILDIKILGDNELEVIHKDNIPDFDLRLAYANGAIFSLKSFDEKKAIQNPIGTGPFKFKDYDKQKQILYLERFDEYRLGKAKVDKITFYNIPDANARLTALKTGEVDVIADVGAIMPQQAAEIESNSNLVLKKQPVSTTHYYFMNTTKGKFFENENLRHMLNYLCDRDTIVGKILLGYGKKACSVLSSVNKTFVVDCLYESDIKRAKELKEKVIGNNGAKVVLLLNSSLAKRWPYNEVALMMQARFKEVGLELVIETVEPAAWMDRLKKGNYDIAPQPFTVSSGEPNFFFVRNVYSKGSNNVSRNYGINDAKLDELIKKVAVETSKEKRIAYYKEMQEIMKEKAYIMPLWYDITLYAVNKKVKDFSIDITFCPNLFVADIEN